MFIAKKGGSMTQLPKEGAQVVYQATAEAAPVLGCVPGQLIQDATVVAQQQGSGTLHLRLVVNGLAWLAMGCARSNAGYWQSQAGELPTRLAAPTYQVGGAVN
jgi:hypothetical protein